MADTPPSGPPGAWARGESTMIADTIMAIMPLTARIGLGGPRTPRTLRPLGRQSRPLGLGRGDTRLGRQQVHCGARHPDPVRDEPGRRERPPRRRMVPQSTRWSRAPRRWSWPSCRCPLLEVTSHCLGRGLTEMSGKPGRQCEIRQPVRSPESRSGEFAERATALLRSWRPWNCLTRIAYFRAMAGSEQATGWTARCRWVMGFNSVPGRTLAPKFQPKGSFCCRVAADVATVDRRCNFWL